MNKRDKSLTKFKAMYIFKRLPGIINYVIFRLSELITNNSAERATVSVEGGVTRKPISLRVEVGCLPFNLGRRTVVALIDG